MNDKLNINIPHLRFPEFNDSWGEKQYDDFYSFKTTNSFSRDKLNYERGEVKNIHYGDIHTKFDSLFDTKKECVPFINDNIDISRIPDECYLQEGDLVVADASEDYNDIGKTIEIHNLNGEKVLAGLHTLLARKESDEMANDFASFLMKTHRVRIEIMKIAQGTKVLGISKNRLDKIPLIVPTPPEQTKIANFLTAVDQRINLLQKKKAGLEQYKKGVMQRLFVLNHDSKDLLDGPDFKNQGNQDNQEKSRFRLRFKDENGNDTSASLSTSFPDWEVKKLGELGQIITGKTPKTNDKTLWNGDIEFVTPTDIHENTKFQNKTVRTVTKNDKLKILPKNTIIYTCIASIGKMTITSKPSITNQQINSIVLNKGINFEYIYYSLLQITPKIISTQANTTLPIINKTEFSKFKLYIPCVDEQQKIANFLSSIDKSINNLQLTIDNSQLFKKGLLQKMFV
jgi:type I restriction enzyme S subunit